MPTEVEAASGWIEWAVKGIAGALSALFAWIWSTSHRQARLEQQFQNFQIQIETHRKSEDGRMANIERGVGRILNHLTGTNLHDE